MENIVIFGITSALLSSVLTTLRPVQVEVADTFSRRSPVDRGPTKWIYRRPVPILADQNELRDHFFFAPRFRPEQTFSDQQHKSDK